MGGYKSRPHYPKSIRTEVLGRVLSGEMTCSEAASHYDIGHSSTVYRWVTDFEQSAASTDSITASKTMSKQDPSSLEDQASELASTKRLLELERLRTEALMKMIRLAEEKYKIDIEKKSGPKRSKR